MDGLSVTSLKPTVVLRLSQLRRFFSFDTHSDESSAELNSAQKLPSQQSSFDQLLLEKAPLVQSCFYDKKMAIQGVQYFLKEDFLQSVGARFSQSMLFDSIDASVAHENKEKVLIHGVDFFNRINQSNEQYLHFVDAIDGYAFDLDEDSVLAQRDLQRLETKIDLLTQLLAQQSSQRNAEQDDTSKMSRAKFVFTLSPKQLKFSMNIEELLPESPSGNVDRQSVDELLLGINTLLSDNLIRNAQVDTSLSAAEEEQLMRLQKTFIFGFELNPLLHQQFFVPVIFKPVVLSAEGTELVLEADVVELLGSNIDTFEKYIFRLHRRHLAMNRQQRND